MRRTRLISAVILDDMLECCSRSNTVGGSILMWNDQEYDSAWSNNAIPLDQRRNWVRRMLDHMTGNQKILRVIFERQSLGKANNMNRSHRTAAPNLLGTVCGGRGCRQVEIPGRHTKIAI